MTPVRRRDAQGADAVPTSDLVLAIIRERPNVTLAEIGREIGVTRERVRQVAAKLADQGLIERFWVRPREQAEARRAEKAVREQERRENRANRKQWLRVLAYAKPEGDCCRFGDCTRPVKTRGWCGHHYTKLRQAGVITVRARLERPATMPVPRRPAQPTVRENAALVEAYLAEHPLADVVGIGKALGLTYGKTCRALELLVREGRSKAPPVRRELRNAMRRVQMGRVQPRSDQPTKQMVEHARPKCSEQVLELLLECPTLTAVQLCEKLGVAATTISRAIWHLHQEGRLEPIREILSETPELRLDK